MKKWRLAVLTVALSVIGSCSGKSGLDEPVTEPSAPHVFTLEVSNVTENGAEVLGELVSDGDAMLLDKGVVFGTEPDPDLETGVKVSAGRGPGRFSVSLDKLDDWKVYHLRTYATNTVGTAYGTDVVFETKAKKVRVFNLDGIIFKMVFVEGGTFTMGAMADDTEAESYEKPAHKVTLDSYYIGQCEVTKDVWNMVMEGRAPDLSEQNIRYLPAVQQSWQSCQDFISKLNEMTGESFSMPTEAQWEYAARGGKKSAGYLYAGGNDIEDVAWYYANALSNVRTVALKTPNELGLYDMTGNVGEWCEDWYDYYSAEDQVNPVCDKVNANGFRVMRGGSVINDPDWCRVTHRFGVTEDSRLFFVGLRLVLGR